MSGFKIFYNPASRGGRSKKKVDKINDLLASSGVDYIIEETIGPKTGIKQAQDAKEEGFSNVVAMGGDGTVHEIANGAIRAGGLNFGVIPLGSGNDFASGIGMKNWEDSVNTLQNGRIEKISYLKINDHYSVNVLDTGLGADVVKLSETRLKWVSGSLKYTLLTLREAMRHNKYKVTIEIDGKSKDYDLNVLAMGFGQTFGSGMQILPEARYNHEKMQIAIVHSASKIKSLIIFSKIFHAGHINYHDNVEIVTGSKIKVNMRVDRDMMLEGEGEIFSKVPFEAEVVAKALPVFVPENYDLSMPSLKIK